MSKTMTNLKIDSRLVYQLGEALIDNKKVALVELIKNASDADATVCKIIIDTDFESIHGKGKIIIEDNGNGMNDYIIKNSFLKIATSFKNDFQKVSPKFKRIAQGNKGIGRLSLNKLGSFIKITTKIDIDVLEKYQKDINIRGNYGDDSIKKIVEDNENYYYNFEIDWNSFNQKNISIKDVIIEINKHSVDNTVNFIKENHGTKIEIFGIKNPEYWEGDNVYDSLKDEINQLFNPYIDEHSRFIVKVKLNNTPFFSNDNLDKEYIRKTSFSYSKFNFNANTKALTINLKRNNHYIKQEIDNLIKTMQKMNFKAQNYIDYETQYEKYNECELSIDLSTIRNLKNSIPKYDFKDLIMLNNEEIYLPGDFKGEIFAYAFNNKKDEVRKNVEPFLGVKVYRNNFRVLPYGNSGVDWLGMGDFNIRTKAIIYKNHTTTGYVKVDGLDNLNKLKEMTNRQGFQLDNYGNNFILIMRNIVYKSIGELEIEFDKKVKPSSKLIKEMRNMHCGDTVEISGIVFSKLENPKEKAIEKANQLKNEINNTENLSSAEKFNWALDEIEEDINQIDKYSSQKEKAIEKEYEFIHELNPIIGASIVSQSLSHEIKRLSNQISRASKNIRRKTADFDMDLNLIDVNSYYLSKYASLLDVNSRAKRRKYEDILIKEYLKIILKDNSLLFYKNKLYDYNINGEDFIFNGIKSNFKIIIENLILNSLYWLEFYETEKPVINLDIDKKNKKLIVYDNGKGVDNKISSKIFEPFVSNKPNNKGRGMGLYIVSELLKEFGAIIYLDDEKNQYENKYKFVIEFGGLDE